MKVIPVTVLLFIAAYAVNSFEVGIGKCPEVPKIDNFDRVKFSGQWNEIKRTRVPFEPGVKCATSQFNFTSNGDLTWRLTGHGILRVYIDLSIVGEKTNQSNVFKVNLLNSGYRSTISILDTDYQTYAVMMACNPLPRFVNAKDVWVFSRKSELAPETLAKVSNTLEKYGILKENIEDVNKGCN